MTILRPTDETSAVATQGRSYRSEAEIRLRQAVEQWGRTRWPEARVVHELVMDRGTVRADLAFVEPNHFAVCEIKSASDVSDRLMRQCSMFRLAAPELWICAAARHASDAALVRYLIPSIGMLVTDQDRAIGPLPEKLLLDEIAPAQRWTAHQESMLHLLWRAELGVEAQRHGLVQGGAARMSHGKLVAALMRLPYQDAVESVCRQLRGRDAFWRADPPIRDNGASA